MGYRDNSNWRLQTVYLQGVSGRSFCNWSTTNISGTRPSRNECPSWSGMLKISNYRTFNYGARTSFWRIYTFFINVHDWSYITCYNNKTLCKSGQWTNYATQTSNWHKKISIKPTCFIMERIQTDAGTQFTSKDFQEGLSVRLVQLSLVVPDNQ